MTDYTKLKALAESATPGPWHECPMSMFVFGPRDGDMIASTDDNGELLIRGYGARLPMEQNALYIAAADPTTILDLSRRVREAEARATHEYDRGRREGRADVGKYANAIGRIDCVLGRAGALPLGETVRAVEEAVASRDTALAKLAEVEREHVRLSKLVEMGSAVGVMLDRVEAERDALEADLTIARAEAEAARVERDAVATALQRLVAASNEITHWDWSHLLLDHEDCETLRNDAEYLEECAHDALAALRAHAGKAVG
jgi:hypothetical protein